MPHYRHAFAEGEDARRHFRSPKSLNRLRTKERGLVRELGGELELIEIRQPADWAPYAQPIEALMNGTWQARRLGHGFRWADQAPVAARGWLRAFLLRAGGHAVSFVLCYQGMGTLFYEQLGYDQRFAKYSPGALLLYRVMDRLQERDTPDVVDFGEGEADYKKVLANQLIGVSGLMLVRRTLRLRLRFGSARVCHGADRALRWALARSGIKQWLWRKAKQGAV